jgi:hypothetical protein
VQLVARFVVVAYLRDLSRDLRNLYWLREMEAEDGSHGIGLTAGAWLIVPLVVAIAFAP